MGPPPATPRARLDHRLRELEADLYDGGAAAAEVEARLAAEAAATAVAEGLLPAVPAEPPVSTGGGSGGTAGATGAAGAAVGGGVGLTAAVVAAGWAGGPRLGAAGLMVAVRVATGVAEAADGTPALVFGPPPVGDWPLVADSRTPPTPAAGLLRAPSVPSSRWGALGGGIDPRRPQERAGGPGGDPGVLD